MTKTPHSALVKATESHQAMHRAVSDAAAELAAQRAKDREDRTKAAEGDKDHQGS
jgi:hypothetical protein